VRSDGSSQARKPGRALSVLRPQRLESDRRREVRHRRERELAKVVHRTIAEADEPIDPVDFGRHHPVVFHNVAFVGQEAIGTRREALAESLDRDERMGDSRTVQRIDETGGGREEPPVRPCAPLAPKLHPRHYSPGRRGCDPPSRDSLCGDRGKPRESLVPPVVRSIDGRNRFGSDAPSDARDSRIERELPEPTVRSDSVQRRLIAVERVRFARPLRRVEHLAPRTPSLDVPEDGSAASPEAVARRAQAELPDERAADSGSIDDAGRLDLERCRTTRRCRSDRSIERRDREAPLIRDQAKVPDVTPFDQFDAVRSEGAGEKRVDRGPMPVRIALFERFACRDQQFAPSTLERIAGSCRRIDLGIDIREASLRTDDHLRGEGAGRTVATEGAQVVQPKATAERFEHQIGGRRRRFADRESGMPLAFEDQHVQTDRREDPSHDRSGKSPSDHRDVAVAHRSRS
jgi:hypothetical protein